jgi:hypothetical protein
MNNLLQVAIDAHGWKVRATESLRFFPIKRYSAELIRLRSVVTALIHRQCQHQKIDSVERG